MIELRQITEKDTYNIVKWRNTESVRRNLYTQSDLTVEQHLKWINNYVYTGKCVQYIIVIEDCAVKRDIGTIFLKNIDINNRKAEYGIFIGEEECRGKGYALLASKKILEIAFDDMLLNRVYLSVMSDNVAAIRTYEKVGFEYEGILKEDYLRNNKYVDVVLMGMTRKKWNGFQ